MTWFKAGQDGVGRTALPASDWREFIARQFRQRGTTLNEAGIEALLATADLVPYDVRASRTSYGTMPS